MPDALADRAAARWTVVLAERPDLEPAITLQRALVGRLLELMAKLERLPLPRLSLPPKYVAAKLARGVPALRAEPVPVPAAALTPVMLACCVDLAEGGAGDAASHIHEALAGGRLDPVSLMGASIARDQQGIRTTSHHIGLAPDLVWLVAELAVGPYVHLLQRRLWIAAGVDRLDWTRGYCAMCGSWPVFAELTGVRRLRCSFCAAGWTVARHACIYCGQSGPTLRTAAPDPERMDRLLDLCTACGGYFKALQLPQPADYPLAAIEDLATMELDRAAMEHGFARPPLPEIGAQGSGPKAQGRSAP